MVAPSCHGLATYSACCFEANVYVHHGIYRSVRNSMCFESLRDRNGGMGRLSAKLLGRCRHVRCHAMLKLVNACSIFTVLGTNNVNYVTVPCHYTL